MAWPRHHDGGYSFAGGSGEDGSGEGGAPHADHHALWINPNNTNELWLGTDGGVYGSLDKGANWTFKHNLPVGQFYHVAIDRGPTHTAFTADCRITAVGLLRALHPAG